MTDREDYKLLPFNLTRLNPCNFCGSEAHLWQRSNKDGSVVVKAVMCSNFGDTDPSGDPCPLHMPDENFFHATKREAVEYWQDRTAWGRERVLKVKIEPLRTELTQLRQDVARYENGRIVLIGEIARLKQDLLTALEQRNAEVRLRQAAERATLDPGAAAPPSNVKSDMGPLWGHTSDLVSLLRQQQMPHSVFEKVEIVARLLATAASTQPPSLTLEQAYELGWRAAADWAQRSDLCCDIDSPAYVEDRCSALGSRPTKGGE